MRLFPLPIIPNGTRRGVRVWHVRSQPKHGRKTNIIAIIMTASTSSCRLATGRYLNLSHGLTIWAWTNTFAGWFIVQFLRNIHSDLLSCWVFIKYTDFQNLPVAPRPCRGANRRRRFCPANFCQSSWSHVAPELYKRIILYNSQATAAKSERKRGLKRSVATAKIGAETKSQRRNPCERAKASVAPPEAENKIGGCYCIFHSDMLKFSYSRKKKPLQVLRIQATATTERD